MPIALILADDLTGAADTGVQFAAHGWRTLLALEPSGTGAADILAMSTDSRSLSSAAEAGQAVSQVLSALSAQPAYHDLLPSFRLIYKKMDSTLRGYPAAELAALLAMLGENRALIAPAFPPQGRTTLDGIQFMHGQPLEKTSFAADIATSNLLDLFGSSPFPAPELLPLHIVRQGQVAVGNAIRQARGPLIADAETEADLKTLARATLAEGLRVCCGSAGLAAALVECMATPAATQPLSFSPTPGHILAVAGSLNPATLAQVEYAADRGFRVVQPTADFYRETGEDAISETAARVVAALAAGDPVILATPLERVQSAGMDLPTRTPFAFRLAQVVAAAFKDSLPGGLMLNGGDTARAVFAVIGCTRLWLGGQIEPGIPWGMMADGRFPSLPVITKAGGFGQENSLYKALKFLRGEV